MASGKQSIPASFKSHITNESTIKDTLTGGLSSMLLLRKISLIVSLNRLNANHAKW